MKKLLIAIIVIAVIGVAYYLISPAFRVIEVDEASPLDGVKQVIDLNNTLETSVQVISAEKAAKMKEGEAMMMKEGEANDERG